MNQSIVLDEAKPKSIKSDQQTQKLVERGGEVFIKKHRLSEQSELKRSFFIKTSPPRSATKTNGQMMPGEHR